MGITGLLGMLKDATIDVSLSDLNGTVAVIDTYCWLHKALFPVSMDVYLGKPVTTHITFCMRKVKELRQNNIKPIFVFDGRDLQAKLETEKVREENRAKARAELDKLIKRNNMSEARKIVARCVDITPDIARQLIEKLIEEKIDFVVAPYEADAQIAYLVRNGFAHYAISEDSDLILYGCEYVLYKLNAEGGGTLFQLASLPRSLADFHKGGFCFDTFKRMCILSGCDYLPNIPNVGLQKAKRFFASGQPTDMRKALPQLPNVLKMKKLTVSQEYIAKFIEAENTFRHQLVYCPRAKKMRPVTDYDENQNPDEMLYAGDYLPEPIDLHFAIGNVDFEKLSVIDESWLYNVRQSLFDNEKSIWNEAYQLEDKDALNKIWNRLTKSATVRPDFLDQIHNSAAKKPRIERSEVSEQVRKSLDKVQMDDQEVTFISQTSTHHEVTSLSNEKTTIYNESTQKNTQIVVRSRFFKNSNHTGNEDEIKKESIAKIASIFESRKKIKRKVELLYGSESDKISSQSSVDSGYDAKSSQSS